MEKPQPPITLIGPDRLPQGPFTWEEVRKKIEAGEIRADTPAHTPGLSEWTPISQVMAHLSLQPLPPAPALGVARPDAYAVTMAPPSDLRFATFVSRALAYLVDRLLLSVVSIVVVGICEIPAIFVFLKSPNHDPNDASMGWVFASFILGLVVASFLLMIGDWLYHAGMESMQGATIGKQVFGIHVTDVEGRPISFGRATARHFARIFISNSACFVGYLLALLTERKQSLHDLIASTLVIER